MAENGVVGYDAEKRGGGSEWVHRRGGRIPWLVVSSTAEPQLQAIAGYVCDGTNDEVEIQQALNDWTEVWLFGGFSVVVPDGSWAVDMPLGRVLRGVGRGHTYIENQGTEVLTQRSWLIRCRGTIDRVDFYPYRAFTGGIYVRTVTNHSINDVYVQMEAENSIGIQLEQVQQYELNKVWIDAGFAGFNFADADENVLVGLAGVNSLLVDNCRFDDGGTHIKSTARIGGNTGVGPGRLTIRDSRFSNCEFGYVFLEIKDSASTFVGDLWVERNVFLQASANGPLEPIPHVHLKGKAGVVDDPTFNSAQIRGNVFDVGLSSVRQHAIKLEDLDSASPAGSTIPPWVTIEGNIYDGKTWDHVILIDASDRVLLNNNIVQHGTTETANTYDVVHVMDACDQIHIRGLIAGIDDTALFRHGINFANAGITDSTALDNRLPTAGFGSAPINVTAGAGVELSWPADATYGDNFT